MNPPSASDTLGRSPSSSGDTEQRNGRTEPRSAFGALLARLGRSPLGSPTVTTLGRLARLGVVPGRIASSAIRPLVSLRGSTSTEIRRTLPGGSRVGLRLDLTCSGCLELLLAPTKALVDGGTTSLLLELARTADLVVDVGANVGVYTYLVAANFPNVRVVALEPVAVLAGIIADNIRRNGWDSRVSIRQDAVGAVPGQSVMYVLPNADTEHTLEVHRIAGRQHETVTVSVVAIDDLLATSGVPLDRTLLKIDVEGHETAALDGMDRTLRHPGRRPDVIMEFLGRAIEHERIIERVIGYGMDVYYVGPGALTRLRSTADLGAVHTLGYWNFLLTSRSADEVSALSTRLGIPLRM